MGHDRTGHRHLGHQRRGRFGRVCQQRHGWFQRTRRDGGEPEPAQHFADARPGDVHDAHGCRQARPLQCGRLDHVQHEPDPSVVVCQSAPAVGGFRRDPSRRHAGGTQPRQRPVRGARRHGHLHLVRGRHRWATVGWRREPGGHGGRVRWLQPEPGGQDQARCQVDDRCGGGHACCHAVGREHPGDEQARRRWHPWHPCASDGLPDRRDLHAHRDGCVPRLLARVEQGHDAPLQGRLTSRAHERRRRGYPRGQPGCEQHGAQLRYRTDVVPLRHPAAGALRPGHRGRQLRRCSELAPGLQQYAAVSHGDLRCQQHLQRRPADPSFPGQRRQGGPDSHHQPARYDAWFHLCPARARVAARPVHLPG